MKFMTMNEVAETLSVSRMTIHRLVGKGEIKSLKIGRVVRIPEESLKEYVDRNLKGNGGEYSEEHQKKRISLRGIAKGGQPISEEDINEVWDDEEHLPKRRFSLQGIIKGGDPIPEEAIDEVIKEWERE